MRKWKAVLIVLGCLLVSSLLITAAFFAINKRLFSRDCFDALKTLTKKDLRIFFQPLLFLRSTDISREYFAGVLCRLMPGYSLQNRLRVNKTYYHVIESLT